MERQYIVFEIRDGRYMTPTQSITSIEPSLPISKLPMMPKHIRGVTQLREKVLTVIDTAVRLGEDPIKIQSNSRLIVLNNSEDNPCGFLVDSATEILRVDDKDIDTKELAHQDNAPSYLIGYARVEEQLFPVVDLTKMAS